MILFWEIKDLDLAEFSLINEVIKKIYIDWGSLSIVRSGNRNTLLRGVIQKELDKVRVAFKLLEEDDNTLIGS